MDLFILLLIIMFICCLMAEVGVESRGQGINVTGVIMTWWHKVGIHDSFSIFSCESDSAIANLRLSVCQKFLLKTYLLRNVHILHILALATVAMQILLPLLIGVGIWCLEMFTNYTNYIIPMEGEGRADSNMSLMYLAWSFRSHDQKKSFDSVLFDPVDLSGLVEYWLSAIFNIWFNSI